MIFIKLNILLLVVNSAASTFIPTVYNSIFKMTKEFSRPGFHVRRERSFVIDFRLAAGGKQGTCQIVFASGGSSPEALYPVEKRISPDIGRHIAAHLICDRAVVGKLLQDCGLQFFHAHLLIGL